MSRPRVTATRLVYENRWIRLREDTLQWPDGRPGLYSVVEKSPGAVIAPVESKPRMLSPQPHWNTATRSP